MTTDKCLDAFMNQIEYDKEFAADLNYFKLQACGRHLLDKCVYYSYNLPPTIKGKDEFLDFIDGNGFKVKQHGRPNMYRIYPIYKDMK